MGPYCFPIQKSTWMGFQTETPTKNDWETVLYNNKSLKKGHWVLIPPSINSSLTPRFLPLLCCYIVRTWTLMTDSWKRKGEAGRKEKEKKEAEQLRFFSQCMSSLNDHWLLNRQMEGRRSESPTCVQVCVCTADWFFALKKREKSEWKREEDLDAFLPASPSSSATMVGLEGEAAGEGRRLSFIVQQRQWRAVTASEQEGWEETATAVDCLPGCEVSHRLSGVSALELRFNIKWDFDCVYGRRRLVSNSRPVKSSSLYPDLRASKSKGSGWPWRHCLADWLSDAPKCQCLVSGSTWKEIFSEKL